MRSITSSDGQHTLEWDEERLETIRTTGNDPGSGPAAWYDGNPIDVGVSGPDGLAVDAGVVNLNDGGSDAAQVVQALHETDHFVSAETWDEPHEGGGGEDPPPPPPTARTVQKACLRCRRPVRLTTN